MYVFHKFGSCYTFFHIESKFCISNWIYFLDYIYVHMVSFISILYIYIEKITFLINAIYIYIQYMQM